MDYLPAEFFTLEDVDPADKTIFLRIDVNSPINPETGEIIGSSRFFSHIDTINSLVNSRVVLLAHQSRPGKEDFTSLDRHALTMQRILGRTVDFEDSLFSASAIERIRKMSNGDILMLENTRFYSEEVSIDYDLEVMEGTSIVRKLSPLMDLFVNDAFPSIHRAQTTLVGFQRVVPNISGKLIEREIRSLDRFLKGKESPKVAVLAGAKINESISVAKNFLESGSVDRIITGGVVANAFLWASGKQIGKKNEEFIVKNNKNHQELIKICKKLLEKHATQISMPVDFVMKPSGKRVESGSKVPDDQVLADVGVDTIVQYIDEIREAGSIFLNGPIGMYEIENYSIGTSEIFRAIANHGGLRIAGGGHTLSALEMLGLLREFNHASTGGGALISYLSGETMPVLEALKASKKYFDGNADGKRSES